MLNIVMLDPACLLPDVSLNTVFGIAAGFQAILYISSLRMLAGQDRLERIADISSTHLFHKGSLECQLQDDM